MLTRKEVEEAPSGITYLTLGHLKRHVAELAGTIEGIFSGEGAQVSDEEFRNIMLEWRKSVESDLNELFNGFNYLADAMKRHGIIPAEGK